MNSDRDSEVYFETRDELITQLLNDDIITDDDLEGLSDKEVDKLLVTVDHDCRQWDGCDYCSKLVDLGLKADVDDQYAELQEDEQDLTDYLYNND